MAIGMPNGKENVVGASKKKVENPWSNPQHRLTQNSNHSHIVLTEKFFGKTLFH